MPAAVFSRAKFFTGTCLAVAALLPCASARAETSPFRPERFDEDWSEADAAPFGAQFKNVELVDGVTLSIGGDARWRVSALDAPRLGLGGAESDAWLLQRLLLHADLRFEDNARIFVQLGAHDGIDREIPSSSDDNQVDVQQAFFDVNARFGEAHFTARTGRQELALGSRFVTTRDGGNVRQRHDLVRLIITDGPWRADLFGGSPVVDERGAFDDEPDVGQDFYGARLQRQFSGSTLDLYAYELDRDTAALTGVSANDDRVSLGARLSGRDGAADFDVEVMTQHGSFGGADIRALGSVAEVGWRFAEAPLSPRLSGRFTYGSGDADLGDATQGTFAPPFANGQWFGQNGLASFSNTIETAGLLGLTLSENVSLNMKVAADWRAETADFVYAGAVALADTDGGDDTFIGASTAVSLSWRPNDNVTVNPYVSYVCIGDELKTRGADDVVYAHLSIALRF